jgi:hypothetical protein
LPQAVQDSALDAVLGIGMEGHIFPRVVLGDGIEEPEHAGVSEIVQIHMHGKIFMNANGDRLHQRQVLEHDPVAHFLGDSRFLGCRHTGSPHAFVLFSDFFRISGYFPDDLRNAALVPKVKRYKYLISMDLPAHDERSVVNRVSG